MADYTKAKRQATWRDNQKARHVATAIWALHDWKNYFTDRLTVEEILQSQFPEMSPDRIARNSKLGRDSIYSQYKKLSKAPSQ